jgi:RNA polymerase sigma factor (sigma-70 family)
MPRQALVDHIPGLRRYARALTADTWSADDLVQDTLERACSKWRLWLVGSDLRAWLFALMHNLHANHVRRAVRDVRSSGPLVDVDSLVDTLAASPTAPETGLDLQRCLMRLPEDQRVVLLLVTLEDLPYAQVAQILKVPVGTVMSRLSRARSRLRELMDAGGTVAAPSAPVAGASGDGPPVLRRMK